ncbi:MAG: thiamine-phosphate kinase, partial [Cyclobacteriaceae bacterium]|nr:thiamine-phosphate kinase [Cyclobacteriaceae bacterium]
MDKRTEITELGEFGLIDRITKNITNKNNTTKIGVGDDAAVIDVGKDYLLLSTDMLIEGVHFDLSYMPIQHLGYKSISINVSDIAAMNGSPEQVVVSLGLSNRFSVEAVEKLYEGMKFACKDFNVDLVGGDTTSSPAGLIISVSIIGRVEKDKVALRSKVEKGDIICATGDLGGAYIGLQVLEREKQVFLANPDMQPDLKKYPYIAGRQLKPEARMDIIHELAELNVRPKAMIDISDGLASELYHLSKQSDVGFFIYEDKLPIDKQTYDTAVEFNIDPITCVMNGGEDYELLFSISQEDFEKLKNHPDIHFIGYAAEKEKGINLVTKNQNVVPIKAQGWDHF